jgi:hypothetical protein
MLCLRCDDIPDQIRRIRSTIRRTDCSAGETCYAKEFTFVALTAAYCADRGIDEAFAAVIVAEPCPTWTCQYHIQGKVCLVISCIPGSPLTHPQRLVAWAPSGVVVVAAALLRITPRSRTSMVG